MREIAFDANRQYFVEGSFNKIADEFIITARIWDSQTLEQVDELISRNWDIYAAIDELSKDVRRALEVPESGGRIAEDLPLAETYGESEEALKAYIEGLNARLFENDFEKSNAFFDRAISIDANFVLGWFVKAVNMIESGNLPAAQEALAAAQNLDYRLPEQDRAQLKAMSYRLRGEHEKLMAFLRLRVKIYDDASSHTTLATILMVSGELQEAKSEFLSALERDNLNAGVLLQLSALERATGDMEAAVDYARQYQQQKPEDIEANILLGDLLRDNGEFDDAEKHYQQAQILENDPVQPTLRLSLLAARKGDIRTATNLLSEAQSFAQTPQDEIAVRQEAAMLEFRLGRVREAIRLTYEREEFVRQTQAPFAIALGIYAPMVGFHLELDETTAAREALATALAMLQAPMDQFLAFSEAQILAREGDFAAAEASVERGIDVIDRFKLKVMEFQVSITRAWIAQERGDNAAMADHYITALDLIEHSVMANELHIAVPRIYAGLAVGQVRSDQLDAAERSIAAGFRLDPSEPVLWLVKARLQQAQDMPQLALASVNYALAIWKDADTDYIMAGRAEALAAELSSSIQ